MYNVMLVDDEALILNGLKNLIDWTSLNIFVEDMALSGEEALDKFKSNPADIVITDICMPKLNGLDLIKQIKKLNENTKFIVLSGYDDFKYAKESISIGIENYILKPINDKELFSTLKNITDRLSSEIVYNSMMLRNKEILKNNIFYRLLTNNISIHELKEREFILDISLEWENYSAAIVKCNLGENSDTDMGQIYNYIDSKIQDKRKTCIFSDMENNICVLFGDNSLEGFQKRITCFLEDIKEDLSKKFDIKCFITQGSIEGGCQQAYKSYEFANKLQSYLLVQGYDRIISYSDYAESSKLCACEFSINSNEFEKIILSKNQEAIDDYIDNTFEKLRENKNIKPELIQNVAIKMLMELNKICNEFNIESSYNSLRDMIVKICTIRTVEELKNEIKQDSNVLVENIRDTSQKMSPITKQVLSYIKENYYKELSLKTLGNKYNINPFYLGQVFHKEVGQNFSEFINKFKNEKAKELLLTSNLKVSEVAKRVGYTDNSYFYRKFKEHFGVSPNSIRENKNY